MSAECMIEGRQIAKAGVEGNRTDGEMVAARIEQPPVGQRKPAAEHELRQRRALAFEQLADIARADLVPFGQSLRADIVVGQVFLNVGFDRFQTSRTRATSGDSFFRIARRTHGNGDQIMNIGEVRFRQARVTCHQIQAGPQQMERIARLLPNSFIEAASIPAMDNRRAED